MSNSFNEIVNRLNYPFDQLISPYADQLDQLILNWLQDYDVPQLLKNKLAAGRFGNLAAQFFPNASYDQLIVMTRWNLCFFAFDDLYGPKQIDELVLLCDRAVKILQGNGLKESDNEIFRQMSIIRNELLHFTNEEWMSRFIDSMKLFFEGMKTDTAYSYRQQVKYPSLSEYVLIREKIVATYPLLDMIDIENSNILSEDIVNHSFIRRARQLACLLVSFSNDIFSLRKELQDHEAMNLVAVIMNEQHCDLQTAINLAIEIHNRDLKEFIEMSANIPDFGKQTPVVFDYFNSISLLLQGHINWYRYTKRY